MVTTLGIKLLIQINEGECYPAFEQLGQVSGAFREILWSPLLVLIC